MREINALSGVMGHSFDATGERINAMEQAIRSLIKNGVDPASEEVQGLRNELDRLKGTREILDTIFSSVGRAVSTSVTGIIQGPISLKQAFLNMGQSIAASLVDNAINKGLKLVEKAVEDLLDELAKSGLIKQIAGGLAGLFTSSTSSTSTIPAGETFGVGGAGIVEFQHGGVVTKGGLAMVDKAEAVVPLGMLGRGGDTIIINNNTDAQVTHKTNTAPNGRKIREFIIQNVGDGIGGGDLDKVFGQTFGLRRQPTAR